MKLWKALVGLGVLAAAVVPYRVKKNEEDGSTEIESLLMKIKANNFVDEDGKTGRSFDVSVLPMLKKEEPEAEIEGLGDDFDEFYLRDETFEESLQRGEDEQEDMKDVFEAAAAAGADAVRDYTGAPDEAPRPEGFADPKITISPAE